VISPIEPPVLTQSPNATLDAEAIEQMRQQFDNAPYPNVPLEKSPKDDYDRLFVHNVITPFYLRSQQVVDPKDMVILDAGCGSGYTSLTLAEANPGARIIGVDLSAASVELADQRLKFHGFTNCEFHALSLEDLPQLDMTFDYINCDEVLYLIPDMTVGLRAMQAVLKPHGLIRTNLHNAYQRGVFFQAQQLCQSLGLMNGAIGDLEIESLRELMRALKDDVRLKAFTWRPECETDDESLRANLMLQGDKGFTIPQVFEALRATQLEFVSMVRWREWEILDLFKEPDNLPPFFAMGLEAASLEEKLHLFELLQPVHRLIDFWCGHENYPQSYSSALDWDDADWQATTVHFHPQLAAAARESMQQAAARYQSLELTKFISLPTTRPVNLESSAAACLLPLLDGPQPFMALVDRWLKICPVNPVTLEPVTQQAAIDTLKALLASLEVYLYVLLARS